MAEPYPKRPVSYFHQRSLPADFFKSAVRPILYKIFFALFANKISGIFSISEAADRQYAELGVPVAKIFPFAYFVALSRHPYNAHPKPNIDRLRAVYVGNLSDRKGVDLLIEATRIANREQIVLQTDFFGPGSAETYCFDFEQNVFRGRIPFGDVPARIREYDLVIIPSRYDGWSVVVNEAVAAGVPILCSVHAGAWTVVSRYSVGWTYDPYNIHKFPEVIALIKSALAFGEICDASFDDAHRALSPTTAASYLKSICSQNYDSETLVPWR